MVASNQTWRVKKDRKRATTQRKSCDTCHKSKTRCDRRRPVCSTCEIFGRRCTYIVRDQEGPSKSPDGEQASSIQRPGLNKQHKYNREQPSASSSASSGMNRHFQQLSTVSSYASDIGPLDQDSLPQLVMSSTNSSSPDDLFDNTDGLYTSSSDLQLISPTSSESPSCVWCHDSSLCSQCQQIHYPDFTPLGELITKARPVAQVLMEAMAANSDRESSTILAAIRIGIPWHTINNALTSIDYPMNGLACVLEQHQKSQASADALLKLPTQPHGPTPIVDQHVWHQLQYEASSAHRDDQPQELIGSMKHARRSAKAVKVPLLQQADTSTSEGGRDIRLPTWAILPMRVTTNVVDPFDEALNTMQAEVAASVDIDAYCGSHAYLDALLRSKHSHTTPRLSQIVARLIERIRPDEVVPSVTSLAMMWLYWCVFSWMLSPTRENFERIPESMRPTPWQICRPHILVYDFIVVPALRDQLCNNPPTNNAWLTDALQSVVCTWPKTALHALCRNSTTKALDLHVDCKTHAARAQDWSLGPSVRAHLPNVDEYMSIRTSSTPIVQVS